MKLNQVIDLTLAVTGIIFLGAMLCSCEDRARDDYNYKVQYKTMEVAPRDGNPTIIEPDYSDRGEH